VAAKLWSNSKATTLCAKKMSLSGLTVKLTTNQRRSKTPKKLRPVICPLQDCKDVTMLPMSSACTQRATGFRFLTGSTFECVVNKALGFWPLINVRKMTAILI
jgi:hypothetical protein